MLFIVLFTDKIVIELALSLSVNIKLRYTVAIFRKFKLNCGQIKSKLYKLAFNCWRLHMAASSAI